MDQDRFDDLTRTLSSGVTRREVMRGIAGASLGGILAAVGIGSVAAKGPCRAPNTKCGKGKNAVCCPAPANGAAFCDGMGGCAVVCNPGFCPNGGQCGSCCTPRTCDYYAGQCGVNLPDGCGSFLTCDCPSGQACCDGQTCSRLDIGAHCGACDNQCPTCPGAGGPSCETNIDGIKFCAGGGYCFRCTSDADCNPGFRCVDYGVDDCGAGYTTSCTVAC